MKRLNITKEQFNRSKYFQRKYGTLKYVSESGKYFKTNKGKVLKFVNEGRLADKLNSGELFDKSSSSLERAVQKFLESDGVEGEFGGWRLLTEEDTIKIYDHGKFVASISPSGELVWEDEMFPERMADQVEKVLTDAGIANKANRGKFIKFNESKKRQFNEKLDYVGSTANSVTLCNDCPFCGEHYEFTLNMDFDKWMDSMWKWKYGEPIQNAFPDLSPDEREQIKTGICKKCWDSM